MSGSSLLDRNTFSPSVMRVFLVLIGLLSVMACSHHPPAPVEEHSNVVKRQLNRDGSYSIRSGDTLYAIAFNFDVDARKLAEWNGISSPYVIYPGQKLRLTAPPASKSTRTTSSAVKTTALKTPGNSNTKTTSKPPGSTPKKVDSKSATSNTVKAASPAVTTASDPKDWRWPAKGRVLRGYVAGDPARNGLDIGGNEGQDIKASSGGLVVYSGNGLIGYGELIIIKHSERMLSAYAHNRVRLVQEGEQVSSGQKIAEMGRNTGDEQLLHFEIRVRGKPVNPLNYLPKK